VGGPDPDAGLRHRRAHPAGRGAGNPVGLATTALVVNCDRTSNGPHLYYPNPRGPGGTGAAEDWVMDNFGCDPLGGHAMLATAENVARRHGIGTAEQHEVVLVREQQYAQALADDSAFLRRFMSLPFDVPAPGYKKWPPTLEGDEGVSRSTAEGLAALKPVMPGGTVTYGAQTHPADGNAGIVVTTAERARELATDPKIAVRLHGFGQARVELAYMPEAPAPAASGRWRRPAWPSATWRPIKTHNPFALNDLCSRG
jgi:acetyl-CoA acetyltransferase